MTVKMRPMTMRTAELRKLKGWSQAELAHRSGLSQSTISRLETGDQNATLGAMRDVSAALGVTVPELFVPLKQSDHAALADRFAQMPEDQRIMIEALVSGLEMKARTEA